MDTVESRKVQINIIEQFRLLHQMLRIIGLYIFQLPNNRTDSIKTTSKDVLFGIAVIILLWFACLYNFLINVRIDLSNSLIVNATFNAVLLMIAIHSTLLLVANVGNRHKIWLILCECYDFDEEVRELCHEINDLLSILFSIVDNKTN